jgi:hypothetical protein
MDEYYQLLIIVILISLYCDYKYSSNYILQAFFVFSVVWLSVIVMSKSLFENDEFAIVLVSFHTIVNMFYIYYNFQAKKAKK